MASAASSRARPNSGRTAANAAANPMMLAPSGRNSVPGPAVTDRRSHHKARRPRLARTNVLRRSGGATNNAASRSTAAIAATAKASPCQKPPSRRPATAPGRRQERAGCAGEAVRTAIDGRRLPLNGSWFLERCHGGSSSTRSTRNANLATERPPESTASAAWTANERPGGSQRASRKSDHDGRAWRSKRRRRLIVAVVGVRSW